jgi:hypothetical protein
LPSQSQPLVENQTFGVTLGQMDHHNQLDLSIGVNICCSFNCFKVSIAVFFKKVPFLNNTYLPLLHVVQLKNDT